MSLFLFIFRSIPANIPNFATNNVERIQLVSVAGISTLSASQMCVSSLNDTRPTVYQRMGCRHSSVDSSMPSILRPQVKISSTPSMLFSIYIIEIVIGIRKERK